MELTRNIDYRIQGYYKKKIYDVKGDLVSSEFYKSYNEGTQTYSNLKVKEVRVVERDVVLGIPEKITVDIEWYHGDQVTETKQIIKPINSFDGMGMNEASRKRLVGQAQGYLLGEVGLANTKDFANDIISERAGYIAGTRQPLIDAINTSAKPYMTAPIKATLVALLDIDY